jgi:hypothetical protein
VRPANMRPIPDDEMQLVVELMSYEEHRYPAAWATAGAARSPRSRSFWRCQFACSGLGSRRAFATRQMTTSTRCGS